MAGTPKYIIAEIIELDQDTMNKHYAREIKTAKTIAIERIAKTVYQQATQGDGKAQALYLKCQGSDHGWIEKHVVENVDNEETQALRDKVAELEGKYNADY
jgi:hypothetical protein